MNYNVNGALQSMGGVAYSMQSNTFINTRNPASYVAFDSLSFIADAAFSIVNNRLSTLEEQQSGAYARLEYLTIGLPINRIWSTSAGILPMSDLGYLIVDTDEDFDGEKINYLYVGEGGMQQLYWGNAFKVAKGFSIGVNLSYIFGTYSTSRFAEYEGENYRNTGIRELVYVDGIHLSAGLQYALKIDDKHSLNFGATYENTLHAWTRDNFLVTCYRGDYANPSSVDTIAFHIGDNALKGTMRVPQSLGAGVSYSFKEKLLVGADFTWQNWNNFQSLSQIQQPNTFSDNFIVAAGAQFSPNPLSKKYLNRMNFRAGVRYSTGYITAKGAKISEIVASVGLGFPLRTFNNKSAINVLFEYKNLGPTTVLKQEYFAVTFNFVLQEKWYRRTQIE